MKKRGWLSRKLLGVPDDYEDDRPITEQLAELARMHKAATPAEREELDEQLEQYEAAARLFGMTDEEITETRNALGIPKQRKPSGALTDKAAQLAALRREHERALSEMDDEDTKDDLKAIYEIERRKILES
ncbi:MAG: hypothetical protein M3362_00585 [Acidobacteriota bacterium]|nr:hypothetical protein [Acidobacteriota bacterium]